MSIYRHFILDTSLITILLLIPVFCHAQNAKIQNLPKYDNQLIHFGFTLGVNKTNFILRVNPDITQLDSIYVVEPAGQSGFNLGIVSNVRLGYYFDMRFIPSLSFVLRKLEYTIVGTNSVPKTVIKDVESTFLDFPLELKYKSVRIHNSRAYVLTGIKYSIDLASQAGVIDDDEITVKLKKHDFYFQIGFGLDFYLQYFKFSPQIKLSYGFNNMLFNEKNNIFSQSIDQLHSKIILVSFTFE